MRLIKSLLVLPAALLLLATGAGAGEIDDFYTAEWNYQLAQNPVRASLLGDRRFNDRWPDLSLSAIAKEHEHDVAALAKLKTFDRTKLSAADQLNYDLFERETKTDIERYQYRFYLLPVSQRAGVQTTNDIADSLRFETVKDYEDWLKRLESFPTYMDQTIALMTEGIRTRTLFPKVIMDRVPPQIDRQIVSTPEASPFFKRFTNYPASIGEADRARLTQAAKTVIAERVVPSYRKFKQFFTEQYLPASFSQVGFWQVPEGDKLYAFEARRYTTTNLTPQQIHELGLSEVKRIRGQMQAIADKAGFKGTIGEFFTFLRTDPRFYYKTSDELLEGYRSISKRIDPYLVKLFKKLPRGPYGVEPIPAAIAPDTTTAYYRQPAADGSRAGTYFVNLYKPEVRPKYEMMALSLHEGVPGHHLQIALAQELGEVPAFRRYGGYTAFSEGWGLYAESLGDDVGLYDDPYAKFGQLTYEMWRAVRLVVDTGMHSLRWDRKKAIDFFLDNAAKQELDVINEIDRYIATPGQALAYKIGELKIKQLREKSRQTLGNRFDIREFHDVVLSAGAVPLDVLERNVDAWLLTKKGA